MSLLLFSGCSPNPLAHYLKALGILRLIAEQCDSVATGRWERDSFHLHSTQDQKGIVHFFLHDYQPTSVIAPWNGGSGFFLKDNDAAITAIEEGKAERFANYRLAIKQARDVLHAAKLKEKPDKEAKDDLLRRCRNTLDDRAVAWCDAAFVLGQDGAKYPPLLGTGGNDGRLEFTNNFMQRLGEVFDPATGEPTPNSADWLLQALFAENVRTAVNKSPIGQFFPGAAGGANATSGFDGPSIVNPWDYILMIEGALLFAASSSKKLESAAPGSLIYPFCVRQAGVGYGSAALADEADARAEMWMPLWERPTTLGELSAIFGEGRAQVGGRTARNGVDFARAVVTLGVDRGITEFQRFGFQVRNGLAYFATPLERFRVRRNTRADLLTDVDAWLDRFRSKATSTNPPAPSSATRALQNLEARILDLCRDERSANVQGVLIALGRCEAAMARSLRWTKETAFLRPIPLLRSEWLRAAWEGGENTAELRLAASLASLIGRYSGEWFSIRSHLEPVESFGGPSRPFFRWMDHPGNEVVWHDGDPVDALNAVLARRIVRAVQTESAHNLPDTSRVPATFADLAAFIEGDTDDQLLADLLLGLSLLDWTKVRPEDHPSRSAEDRAVPSSLYALLKLCFQRTPPDEPSVPLVPAILRRAARGDGLEASRLAARRLRASGFPPAVDFISMDGEPVQRTAAALLFPLGPWQLTQLRRAVLRHEAEDARTKPVLSVPTPA